MKHILITRLMYKDKALLNHRIDLMNEILIPAIKAQKCKNFDFCIMMFDEDLEIVSAKINYPFVSFQDYALLRDYCREYQYNIQTRHDSDDYMAPDYIEYIQNKYCEISKSDSIFLIHFQPLKIDYHTKNVLPLPQYSDKCISGFVSLCQTKSFDKIVFESSHTEMFSVTNNIYKFPEGYVIYYIHGKNDSLRPREERLKSHKF